ncbi:MAG: SPASM domain-containing protein [Desulfomonilaceae bacterium]
MKAVNDWNIQHVQVQTISWCNRSCEFCPSKKFYRKPHLMSLITYQRIIDELAALGFSGRFSPFLQCEPLLDKRLPELISIAHESLPRAKLLIQTNGDMLTAQKGITLFKAGLHKLVINCYDDKKGRLGRLHSIATEITNQMPDVRNAKGGFHMMIRPERSNRVRQEITIENKTTWTKDGQENWAGNVPGIHLVREPMKAWCFRPFYQLYVHYNGNVVLCCCDWKGDVVFGNIQEKSLGEIFSGPVATTYRQNLKNKNRQMKLCDVCDYPGKLPSSARIFYYVINFMNRLRGS